MSVIRIRRLGVSPAVIMYEHDSRHNETRAPIKEVTGDDVMENLRNFKKMVPYDIPCYLPS